NGHDVRISVGPGRTDTKSHVARVNLTRAAPELRTNLAMQVARDQIMLPTGTSHRPDKTVVVLALESGFPFQGEILLRCEAGNFGGRRHDILLSGVGETILSFYNIVRRSAIRGILRILNGRQRDLRRAGQVGDERPDLVLRERRPEVFGHHRLIALPA